MGHAKQRCKGMEVFEPVWQSLILPLVLLCLGLMSSQAMALPLFARQTGQNCVACHAGGQYPELTSYGRLFKLTGYTIGTRVKIPLSIMGVGSMASVANTSKSDNPGSDFTRNNVPGLDTGSLFVGGKITENMGAFIQATFDRYYSQNADGSFSGHMSADNMDIRYADRFFGAKHDVILGVSLNNNPTVTDPWNTAAAWMQYVPTSSLSSQQFANGPYPGMAAGPNIAGINAYAYLDQTYYAELGLYASTRGPLSFMSAGLAPGDTMRMNGISPYWRLAYNREIGAHNFMIGTSGMISKIFDPGSDAADLNNQYRAKNFGFDAQYQYLLDPHAVTVQLAYMRMTQGYSANSIGGASSPYFLIDGVTPVPAPNGSDTTNIFRFKVGYTYMAKYGGSISLFNMTGTTNTLNQTSGYDSNGQITSTDPNGTGITSTRVNGNLSGNPATSGATYEIFWIPVQYVRIGAQYTAFSKFNGASDNYDGFGRNARDNNTLRLYVWAAY